METKAIGHKEENNKRAWTEVVMELHEGEEVKRKEPKVERISRKLTARRKRSRKPRVQFKTDIKRFEENKECEEQPPTWNIHGQNI